MSNITILPADKYTVVNKTILSINDNKIISMLYQPIIGHTATTLYFTLINDLEKLEVISDDLTHHHLMATMQLGLNDIVEARRRLEGIGLLRTFVKEGDVNSYLYLLYSPLQASDFFNHPVLNVVLYNNLGKNEYEKLLSYYKIPRVNTKEYQEITSSLDEIYYTHPGNPVEIYNIASYETGEININKMIDFNLLISGIPKSSISDKCFTDDIKSLINSLAYAYNLKTKDMQVLVRNSLNEKGLIDKVTLRQSARKYYMFENSGALPTLIYNRQPEYLKSPVGNTSKRARLISLFENLTPYEFLKAKYKNAEPTARDKKLVEGLLIDQKLNPGVVNVLLAYVLNKTTGSLKKDYVETIAGEWKRLNIETVEDALKKTEKNVKRSYKKKDENLPSWVNEDLETKEIDTASKEEIEKLLKEMV